MEDIYSLAGRFGQHALNILLSLSDSHQRVYFIYLATSVLIAWFIYKSPKARMSSKETSFLRFLFPQKVWGHPSAWLDLRYFFFHGLIGKFFMIGLTAAATAMVFRMASGGVSITHVAVQSSMTTWLDIIIATVFMFLMMFVLDFLSWFCHYLQHKSPLLWQFHKVHHSAEVMHPWSNYREHPVDNILYKIVNGLSYGLVMAFVVRVIGFVPSMPGLLGVSILMLTFNVVGYNLRHSHIWLRWPGKLSMIFPSPAHHHVHHSSHPDHIDKNFAFMFPIWDVIFKTYHMPKDNRDVKFGIGEGNAEELNSCARLYWVPVRDAFRVLKAQVLGCEFNMSNPEMVVDHKVLPPNDRAGD